MFSCVIDNVVFRDSDGTKLKSASLERTEMDRTNSIQTSKCRIIFPACFLDAFLDFTQIFVSGLNVISDVTYVASCSLCNLTDLIPTGPPVLRNMSTLYYNDTAEEMNCSDNGNIIERAQ